MDGVIFGVTIPIPSRETVDGRNDVAYEENAWPMPPEDDAHQNARGANSKDR